MIPPMTVSVVKRHGVAAVPQVMSALVLSPVTSAEPVLLPLAAVMAVIVTLPVVHVSSVLLTVSSSFALPTRLASTFSISFPAGHMFSAFAAVVQISSAVAVPAPANAIRAAAATAARLSIFRYFIDFPPIRHNGRVVVPIDPRSCLVVRRGSSRCSRRANQRTASTSGTRQAMEKARGGRGRQRGAALRTGGQQGLQDYALFPHMSDEAVHYSPALTMRLPVSLLVTGIPLRSQQCSPAVVSRVLAP